MLKTIVIFSFLIRWNIFVECCNSLVAPSRESCYTCVCHSSGACNSLFQCAEKTISMNYWKSAGELIAGGENNRKSNDEENYKNCIKDKICILNTMHHYITMVFHKIGDVNCDGLETCADYFAIHNFGMNASKSTSTPSIGISKRFDRCEHHGIVNVTNNWFPRPCEDIRLINT